MSLMLKYKLNKADDGKTVERILKREFDISSKLFIYLKMNKRIFLNEHVCRSIDICKAGDIVSADISENFEDYGEILPWKEELNILFEDDFILVVNKPGGMEVHPCLGNRSTTLANAVMYHWAKSGEYHNYHIVNRLDKDTSGICIIAKNRFSHSVLSGQMKNGEFSRSYTAILHGTPREMEGTIEVPIKRDPSGIIKRVAADDGKYAKTNYKLLDSCMGYSVARVNLETGRTHQIRVHFSHIGHPLVGDWLYGNGDNERELINRQALHAGFVKFLHPENKKVMQFAADLPLDMKNLWEFVKKK